MRSRVSERHQRLPDPTPVIHGLSKGRFVCCLCFFAAVLMLLFLQPGVFDHLHPGSTPAGEARRIAVWSQILGSYAWGGHERNVPVCYNKFTMPVKASRDRGPRGCRVA
jgi:hypothetical protein